MPATSKRPIAVLDKDIDLPAAARTAIQTLSTNPKGYFLMIEWDAHTDNPEKGLNNVVAFDKLIREIAGKVNLNDTLLLFTADHSFDLRMHGGPAHAVRAHRLQRMARDAQAERADQPAGDLGER
ncbi:MAG: alkaline phosphatase [Hyphomicrobium sp.]